MPPDEGMEEIVIESDYRSQRLHHLDWLRVLVIINLVPFHAVWLMLFVPGFSQISKEGLCRSILLYHILFFAQWHINSSDTFFILSEFRSFKKSQHIEI
jgi:hypothetical protein